MKNLIFSITLLLTSFFQFGQIKTGAEQTNKYFSILKNKSIALVVNQTSTIQSTHLVDSLIASNFNIKKVFAPEHGFRGTADAGEHVKNHTDKKTGIPIISLYGENKKPSNEQLKGIDYVIFDIQDVGVRFYTYISTMHYVMEACAEQKISVLILDRPNPNGNYVAGPVLKPTYSSFVGMHPIPIVHGLTVGELAQMINKEKWLKKGIQCDLTIIPCLNYTHNSTYKLPIKPSPNLPNNTAIQLYPTLCLFEPTEVSIGRGTIFPFQVAGTPNGQKINSFNFTPKSIRGMSKHPKHENKICYGIDFRGKTSSKFNLESLILFYHNSSDKTKFFTNPSFFNLLAGNGELIEQIKNGDSCEKIKLSWEPQLKEYLILRSTYLLYPDFD
jgi:uncharacterized protein YbbC (DUF1343 family)